MHIGLVDCNNFFVSCERLFRPDLVGKPVLVLSANDGCVVARSQEVKDIGIPMGVPYFKIKDIVKDSTVTVFSGNLTLYRDVSRRVFEIVRQECSTVEQYSIDEAFFVVPDSEAATHVAERLQQRIWQEVGIPVSVGLAASKTLAKYAAEQAKQTAGIYELSAAAWQEATTTVAMEQLWGVGGNLAARYRANGIYTVADFLAVDQARVARVYGVPGVRLYHELLGTAVHTVTTTRPLQKSLMSSRSFRQKTADKTVLVDAVSYHVRQIAAELRGMHAVAGTIRVSLGTSRHGDYLLRGGSAVAVLPAATNDSFTLIKQAVLLLEDVYEAAVPYQKAGVTVGDIADERAQSGQLFGDSTPDRRAVLQAVDHLNRAYDSELVTVGSQLKTTAWQAKAAARSGAYTTRWSEVPSVSASSSKS